MEKPIGETGSEEHGLGVRQKAQCVVEKPTWGQTFRQFVFVAVWKPQDVAEKPSWGKRIQEFSFLGMPVISGCGAEPRLRTRVKIRKTQDDDKILANT